MKKVLGTMLFNQHIDITDPCYSRNVWCRINGLEIMPGEYECSITIPKNGYRVKSIMIRRTEHAPRSCREWIGNIGVDAGLAGFFNDKKDYTDEEWWAICGKLDQGGDAWLMDDGFFSSSGYGDGVYPVYVGRTDGYITALKIEFFR